MEAHEVKWSYSSLKDYQNCPRQYQEIKVLKNYTKFPTAEMRYGTEVHKAVEDYVGEGKPLAPDYQRFTKQLQPLIEMDGIKHAKLHWSCCVWLVACIGNHSQTIQDPKKLERDQSIDPAPIFGAWGSIG